MAEKSWTLVDVEHEVYVDHLALTGDEIGIQGASITKRTLRGGLREGVDVIEVDTGTFRYAILPQRGMALWKAWHGKTEIGWHSVNRGPVNPMFVPLGEPSGLGWLNGFDELLARCGLSSNGAPDFDEKGVLLWPLHGLIGNRPAHKVVITADDATGEIAVTGTVEETRFHFKKLQLVSTTRSRAGKAGLKINDEVQNLSGNPGEIELLYHINFGPPLLDPGAKLVAPVKELAPRDAHAAEGIKNWDSYTNEQVNAEEQVYFMELLAAADGATRVLLKNAHSTAGISLHFNKKQLPHFTQWKNYPPAQDGYVTGLEPGLNFPNPRSYEMEQDRVVKLKAGESRKFDLELEYHSDAAGVEAAEKAVAALQKQAQPKIFDKPQAGWTKV